MLRREELLERISLSLATLRSYIDLKGLIHLFDTHIIAEDFMANLLNLVFGYNLQNLNYIHLNQPGIDLGDSDSGIAVQVTADKSRRKIQETIDTFVEKQLYIDYPQLYFLTHEWGVLIDGHHLLRPPLCSSIHSSASRSSSSNCSCE